MSAEGLVMAVCFAVIIAALLGAALYLALMAMDE